MPDLTPDGLFPLIERWCLAGNTAEYNKHMTKLVLNGCAAVGLAQAESTMRVILGNVEQETDTDECASKTTVTG